MHNSEKSSSSFSIRPFRPEESSQVLRLVESVLAEFGYGLGGQDDDWDMEDMSAFYAPPSSVFLVLEADNEIVGTVGIKRRSDAKAELRRMYLRSDLRGCGYGKELLCAALEFARSLGCETIFLETSGKLEKAIGLYMSFGFALTDKPGEHSSHLVYEKSLAQTEQ
jgi:putative acetyltransferase